MGLSAGVAGRYGVPLVMVSSDDAGTQEAASLIEGIVTTSTKEGLGRYMGRLVHPSETGPAIEAATKLGIERRSSIVPYVFDEPTNIRVEFNRAEEADQCARMIGISRADGYSVEAEYATYVEAHQVIWNLMSLSFVGIDSQH